MLVGSVEGFAVDTIRVATGINMSVQYIVVYTL